MSNNQVNMSTEEQFLKPISPQRALTYHIINIQPRGAEGNIFYRGCNISRHISQGRVEYLVFYIGYYLPRELLYP